VRWVAALCLLVPGLARAGVEDWRVNEVFPGAGGTSDFRFVELYAPPSDFADNCLFPTSRVEVFGPDGTFLGAAALATATRCFDGDTYFLLAPAGAAAHFGVDRDATLNLLVPAEAGQLCFASSTTRYDCARWGAITGPVADLYDPDDGSSAASIPDGVALARTQVTGVVADDFVLQDPSPRQPNDGSAWFPPDAGPLADAAATPDAERSDARDLPDAPPREHPDARAEDPGWFLADPGGGAVCTCRLGGRGGRERPGLLFVLVGLALPRILRSRRRMR
jgi:hypothetical protein